MSDVSTPQFPPVEIGTESRPPTVVVPEARTVFERRAARFRALAPGHQLEPYLNFAADLSDAQAAIQDGLGAPALPDPAAIDRSISFGMPVLSRTPFEASVEAAETLHRLFDRALDIRMPDAARAALGRVRLAGEEDLARLCDAVLSDAIPVETIAEHVFVGLALQVHFTRAASLLKGRRLEFIGDGVCPVCGGPPASSGIVGWNGSERTRFATCSLCATRWNVVRVKCLACSSTKGIHYLAIEGVADTIKAECCDTCRSYVKIMAEDEDPRLDPIADDVASLGLDLLVKERGYGRAGVNLLMVGA